MIKFNDIEIKNNVPLQTQSYGIEIWVLTDVF